MMNEQNDYISMIKKMYVNRLPFPDDIRNYLKSFIFLDKIRSETRKNQRRLICHLEQKLLYEEQVGHWILYVFPETQLQAVNCENCGEYVFASSMLPVGKRCLC